MRKTGELDLGDGKQRGVFVFVTERYNGFTEGWFAMSQSTAAMDALANFKRVDDYRVLFALLKRLDFNNLIAVNQSEIASELGMDRTNVNHAIKRLVEVGALIKGPQIQRIRSFRLNPTFGWKGKAKEHRKAIQADFLELIEGGRSGRN